MAGGLRERVTMRDAKGNTSTFKYFVASSGTTVTQQAAADAINTAFEALSNAAFQSSQGPRTSVQQEVVYGAAADYRDIEDKARFTFQTPTGTIHRFDVPAPKAAIFLPDGETVDPANTDVVAFTSAMVANAVTQDGEAISFGNVGIRIRRKLHRRFTIFTKNPNLTGPGE